MPGKLAARGVHADVRDGLGIGGQDFVERESLGLADDVPHGRVHAGPHAAGPRSAQAGRETLHVEWIFAQNGGFTTLSAYSFISAGPLYREAPPMPFRPTSVVSSTITDSVF